MSDAATAPPPLPLRAAVSRPPRLGRRRHAGLRRRLGRPRLARSSRSSTTSCRTSERLALIGLGRSSALYLLKGIGSYVSSYLMADVGQRVVMDLRNALYRHILGQSAGVLRAADDRPAACRASTTTSRRCSRRSPRPPAISRASRSRSSASRRCSFYYDAWLAIVCLISAPLIVYPLIRLGQRVRRTTRRSQEALEQLSHISAEAFTGHRIVKAFGSEAARGRRSSAAPAITCSART